MRYGRGGTGLRQQYDTIVLGGGAAGMSAAISSAEHGRRTLLLEKSGRTGRKILASGNGRCNLMNTGKPKYYGETAFAEEVLRNCGKDELERFFRKYGLMIREEKEGRVYPITMQAVSVLNALQAGLKINGVSTELSAGTTEIRHGDGAFLCRTGEGNEYTGDRLIICTGGAAQPKLGGSEDGYRYLQAMGHRLEPIFPALAPVITDKKSISGLAGLRTRCGIALMDGETPLHEEEGEVMFTEYGVSGICVMQCSRFIRKRGLHFELNLLQDAFRNAEEAAEELAGRRETFDGFSPVTLLEGILLPKLSYAVMKQAGIPLRGETADSLTKEQITAIASTGCRYRVTIAESRGLDDAQVTAGGISCREFDPGTMESRRVKGLYAAGEVMNVDGDCGGYNLMFAFASGLIAGGFRKGEEALPEKTK